MNIEIGDINIEDQLLVFADIIDTINYHKVTAKLHFTSSDIFTDASNMIINLQNHLEREIMMADKLYNMIVRMDIDSDEPSVSDTEYDETLAEYRRLMNARTMP